MGGMASHGNTQFAVAVHVLTYLAASDGRPVSSEELATSTDSNPVYVRRVLGPLREAGIVHARPGAGGGWELARPPRSIRLDAVWTAIHDGDPVLGIHTANPKCPIGRNVQRVLHQVDDQASAALRSALAKRTVADVLTEAMGTPARL